MARSWRSCMLRIRTTSMPLGCRRTRPSRPVGRVLYPPEADGDHQSRTTVACRLKRPTRGFGPGALDTLLFGLAPRGVWPASGSHRSRWALTPPFHPYPPRADGMFLCHFPSGHPAWELPSALPVGARTFLSSLNARSDHPACWTNHQYNTATPGPYLKPNSLVGRHAGSGFGE